MLRHSSERVIPRAASIFGALIVAGTLSVAANVCRGGNGDDSPPSLPLRSEIRSGGVIEESYVYYRQSAVRVSGTAKRIEPAGDWHGYGFPVSTFRWGWFGAAHYYPTVFWHDGYYGDCCRFGYRRGY